MEFAAKIVDMWQSLTNFEESPILDVWQGSKYTTGLNLKEDLL